MARALAPLTGSAGEYRTALTIASIIGYIINPVVGAIISVAGGILGAIVFPTKIPKMDLMTSSTIQNASVGGAVSVVYGQVRMAGNIIWVGEVHPYSPDSGGGKKGGGKGGGKSQSGGINLYRRSFLIGLCEGPIVGISKAWKGKEEEPIANFTTFLGDGNTGLATLMGTIPTAPTVWANVPLISNGSGGVKAVRAAHGLTTGTTVAITESTGYNGNRVITYIDADSFSLDGSVYSADTEGTITIQNTGNVAYNYKHLACAFFDEYDLGTSEAIPNFNFEVNRSPEATEKLTINGLNTDAEDVAFTDGVIGLGEKFKATEDGPCTKFSFRLKKGSGTTPSGSIIASIFESDINGKMLSYVDNAVPADSGLAANMLPTTLTDVAFTNNGTGGVRGTKTDHGLITGMIVPVTGTTDYDGQWVITVIDADTFDFDSAIYVADRTGTITGYVTHDFTFTTTRKTLVKDSYYVVMLSYTPTIATPAEALVYVSGNFIGENIVRSMDATWFPISTVGELQAISTDLTTLTHNYYLTNDISGSVFTSIGIVTGEIPIAYGDPPQVLHGLTGKFNGFGYTIRNLIISPLIRYLYYPVDLFDYAVSAGLFGNCGEVRNTILKNCEITIPEYPGKAITLQVGLLAGYASSVVKCSATGTITVLYPNPNGFEPGIGGLVMETPLVINCYARVDCTIQKSALYGGGMIGSAAGNSTSCYSTGKITSILSGVVGKGFGGTNAYGFSSCYWDIETSECTIGSEPEVYPPALNGKTTAEMYQQATFGVYFRNDGVGGVKATKTDHGLTTGNTITITDSTNYNGSWVVTVIDVNNFTLNTAVYVADRNGLVTGKYWWDFNHTWSIAEGEDYPDLLFCKDLNFRIYQMVTELVTPVFVIKDLLTNNVYGAGIPIERLDLAVFDEMQAYCEDNDFLISLALDQQRPLTDWIDYLLSHFEGYLVMDAETIKIGVLRDEESTFTITADDLVVEGNSPPVGTKKKEYKDSFNRIEVLWIDTINNYLHAIVTANDEVDQSISGKVRINKIELGGIGNATYAGKMAWKYLAESMYRSSIYSFTLGYGKMVLQPGDVGTISDGFTIVSKKIRIASISESKDGKNLVIEAIEEVPSIYDNYDYTQQSSEYVKPPAPTLTSPTAYFVEKIGESNELNIFLKPQDAFATGYQVYKSIDDDTYQFVGYQPYISTAGTLVTVLPSEKSLIWKPLQSFDVEVGLQGVLSPVSEEDFFQGNSICKVGEEFIAFETATLVEDGIKKYRISNLIRGMFNSDPVAHSAAEQFIFLKNPFVKKIVLSDVGTTIYFKFLTIYGKHTQLLEDVTSVPYTILGNKYAAGPANLIAIKDREGMLNYSGADVTVSWNLTSRLAGYNSLGYGLPGYGSSLPDSLQHVVLQILGDSICLAGTGEGGKVLYSTDNGLTWSNLGQQFGENSIRCIASLGDNVCLAGTYANGKILRSIDNGLTWTDLGTQFLQTTIGSIVSLGNDICLARSSSKILRSIDNGLTWTDVGNQFLEASLTALVYLGNGVCLVGTNYGKIFRSTDNGLTWVDTEETESANENILCFVSLGGGVCLVGTATDASHGKIFGSTDYGVTWAELGWNFSQIHSLVSLGSGICLAGGGYPNGNIMRSTDSGVTWDDLGQQSGETLIYSFTSLGSGVCLAGTGSQGKILQSIDNGLSWVDLGQQFGETQILCLISFTGEIVLEEQILGPTVLEKLITPTQDVVTVKVIPATTLQSPVKKAITITKIT